MAKFTGALSSFSFGGTVYRCLQNYSWSGSVQDAVAQCSGETAATTVRRPGVPDDTFTFDVIVDSQDVTTLNALKRGETGTFEFHPEGDSASNIEFTATSSIVTQSSLGGGVNQLGILSLTLAIDGALTIQAAV